VRIIRLIKLVSPVLFFLMAVCPLHAANDFLSVVGAAKEIVAGKTFENEDGIRISFSPVRRVSPAKAELTLKVSFPSGSSKVFREIIIQDGAHVRLEQVEGRQRPVNFFISVDEPFHVLRIRPMDDSNTEFLSRECLYQKEDKLHFCYLKSKVGSEVFVSVFAEVRGS
jgi:hypothetical protein